MLQVVDIHKEYEGRSLLDGISFTIQAGETICLLGASGSGKSTLLRIIAGLETPDSGSILWDGRELLNVPVHLREFGLMFQDYALFPHRSVAENVAFGLRMQKKDPASVRLRVQEVLEQVNMRGFAHRRVTELSGGEQQRVALARALAPKPRLLMLDEPLGALDRALRTQLIEDLRGLLQHERIPAIYVTHDQEEAFTIADRLVIIHGGHIAQQGVPGDVYANPANAWIARFLGLGNLLPGKIVGVNPLRVGTSLGVWQAHPREDAPLALGTGVTLLIRPEKAVMDAGSSPGAANTLFGKVTDVVFRGADYRVDLIVNTGQQFQFYLSQPPAAGVTAQVSIPADQVLCIPMEGEADD